MDDIIKDPHLREREMFTKVNHSISGELEVVNFPVKFSETHVEVESAAPALGQYTQEVLESLVAYHKSEIDDLKEKGVI
jgi:crotonobetainyl-CoA:carnitine CoA-transferase CaiB-like acyl-CoA transferase